jgi:PTS system mannose-specific IIA component
MNEENVEVVAGVNLPMLIKISALREKCNMKELIKRSQESGRKYMNVASAFFGEEK